MLAPHQQAEPSLIDFPALVSPKLDGIRCLIFPGQPPQTRSYCPFPNTGLPKLLADIQRLANTRNLVIEGELYAHGMDYYAIQGAVMSYDGDLTGISFRPFDCLPAAEWEAESVTPYRDRLKALRKSLTNVIEQKEVNSWAELQAAYRGFLAAGYEGAIVRRPNGLYLHRRCKPADRELFKLKRTDTFDGRVITLRGKGVRVRMENGTELNLALSAENRALVRVGIWVEFAGTNYGARRKPRFGRFVRWRKDRDTAVNE